MDTQSFIKSHCDSGDVSSQFMISFGHYEGGMLYVKNETKHLFQPFNTYKTLTQFDGRKEHYISDVTCGERYSIVLFKSFDRRYNMQPILNGVRTYNIK